MARSKESFDADNIPPFELVGALIEHRGNIKHMSAARAVNFRCPEHLLTRVDAMANVAGKSRNSMLVHLLSAAIEEVEKTLSDETLESLRKLEIEGYTALNSSTDDREQLEA